jgi:hypothetical protein
MTDYRQLGPAGLDAYLARHGSLASPALDRVCAQINAHTTLLYWFTDLDAALAEARRTRKPVLSLRLLGRLDQELSCANSRFFRRLLYTSPAINKLMRDRFVLHWQTVRPVPIVTIDFGDGRRLERTLTGNSLHLVLDAHGRPVDALPGLFAPDVFETLLARAHAMATASRDRLGVMHERALRSPPEVRPARPPRSLEASMIAPTKHMVEAPILRHVSPTGAALAADTLQNLELHARVHQVFANNVAWTADQVVAWVYEELFLMPPNDPTLGLDVPEPFADSARA